MKSLIICVSILFAFGLSACSSKGRDSDVMTVQMTSEPVTLDFSLAEDGLALRTLALLMSGCMKYDGQSKLQNEMAESFTKLSGGRKYRVKLKPWKWSDGIAVRAQDYLYGLKRTLDPKSPSKLADLLYFVKGALAYRQGKIDFSKVGVRAIDDRTLEFDLVSEFSFFPHLFTLSMTYPQREDVITKHGSAWPAHTPVTGPYKIALWEHDQVIHLERNTEYPNWKDSMPVKVDLRVISDDSTAVNLFESKKLDLVFRFPLLEKPRFRKSGALVDFPFFVTYYIAFDFKKKPWDQRSARAAVAHAIDRASLVKALGSGDHEATSWVPTDIPGANNSIGLAYDLAKAKTEWLKVTNKPDAKSGAYLLGFDSSSKNQMIAEKIREDVKLATGVELELKNRDWKTYVRELSTSTPPIYRFGFLSVFADPFASLFLFESGNPNNYTGWHSSKFDGLLAKVASTDPSNMQRQKFVDSAQKVLLEDDVVAVPIFHYIQPVLLSEKARRVKINGFGQIEF